MTGGQGAAATRESRGRCDLVSRLYNEESEGWLWSGECVLSTKTWTASVWCEPSYKEATFEKRSCCGVPGGAGARPEQTQPHPHGQPKVGGSTPWARPPSHEAVMEGLGPGKPPRLLMSFARSASDPSLSNSMRSPHGGGEVGGEGGGGVDGGLGGSKGGGGVGSGKGGGGGQAGVPSGTIGGKLGGGGAGGGGAGGGGAEGSGGDCGGGGLAGALVGALVGAAVGAVVGALVGRQVIDSILAHLLSPSSA